MGIQIDRDKNFPEIQRLLSTTNYYAMLGHNFGDATTNDTELRAISSVDQYGADTNPLLHEGAEHAYSPDSILYEGSGYRIKTISPSFATETVPLENCGYLVIIESDPDFAVVPQLGAISIGRYLDFPHSADLSLNINYDYDGIKKKRTIGGSDVINVAYSHPPNWIGKFRPFTSREESATIGYSGRRSWELSFSYFDKDKMFPLNFNEGFLFSTYTGTSENESDYGNLFSTYKQENLLSHFYTLTMGGNLPFIFQPDKTKDSFALCRLDKSSFSAKQVAHEVYDISMTFVETW